MVSAGGVGGIVTQETEQGLFDQLDGFGADEAMPDPSEEGTFELGTGGNDAVMEQEPTGAMPEASPDIMPKSEAESEMPSDDSVMDVAEPMSMDPNGAGVDTGFDEALSALGNAFSSVVETMPTGVLIAIVAGLAIVIGVGVGVAVGRRRGPAPVRQEPTVGGPVPTGNEGQEQKDVATLEPENPAFKAYQKILEDKGVPAKDQDIRLRDFSSTLIQLRSLLDDLKPGDPSLRPSVDEARQALVTGDFETVIYRMGRLGEREAEVGLDLKKHAEAQLNAAAAARTIAGDLQFAQMEFADAADSYQQALDALPTLNDERHAEYLNKHGTAAYQAGDMDAAAAAFEAALKVLERLLGEEHPDVATALNNLALLHYSRGNFEAAEPLYQRALVIDEKVLGDDHPGVATDLRASLKIPTPLIDLIESRYHNVEIMRTKYEPAWIF